jgi:hypothetical protein
VTAAPVLSVVVTVVDGGDALRGLLEALALQQGAPAMEVLVAWDDTIPDVAALAPRYPGVRFIAMGPVATARPATSAAGRHELYDRRRSAALPHASGELIGILEDRAWPRADWAATMVRLHHELPHGVIGGAIAPGTRDLLNWSVWAVDYGRYAPPFEPGPRQWVSDVNVCYKRRCIEATRDIWRDRYNEARVHWDLAGRGEVLYLTPAAVVDFHTGYRSLPALLPERFHWGRLFGHVRAGEASLLGRARLVVAGPAVPLVLFIRHAAVQRRLGNTATFARAAGRVFALLVAWTAGELWGALTGRP